MEGEGDEGERASADLVFGLDGLQRSRGVADAPLVSLKDAGGAGGKAAAVGRPDPVAGLVGRISRVHGMQMDRMAALTEQVRPGSRVR